MPNLSRRMLLRLPAGRPDTRHRLVRAAAIAAAPAALILVAGAAAAIAGPAGSAAGTSPFPGHAAAAAPARAASLAGTAAATRTGPHRDWPSAQGPAINWALSGQATVDSSQSGDPASNAIDGNAGTDWCPNSWEGTLTIDLGQARSLNGLGITLDASSPSADATIQLATTSGQWTTLPTGQNVALDPGSPMYLPLPRGTQARYAQINVKSGTGAPVCVGEFRMFGPDPATAHMALGGDLSFTPQELAAGAHFTDRGVPGTPISIMRANGANYVRMRLWVNPPPGYSNLASDLALAQQVHQAGMRIYLDIMYSDFWADPQHENIPAAWQGQDRCCGRSARSTGPRTPAGTTWPRCSRPASPAPRRATPAATSC